MTITITPMYKTKECIEFIKKNPILTVSDDLHKLILLLSTLEPSRKTHYHKLSEWSDPIDSYIRKMLDKNGFVNANVVSNNKRPNVIFWWHIHSLEPCYSPSLVTNVSNHHASASSRNEALKIELKLIEEALKISGVVR
jgi:hypothetical protein